MSGVNKEMCEMLRAFAETLVIGQRLGTTCAQMQGMLTALYGAGMSPCAILDALPCEQLNTLIADFAVFSKRSNDAVLAYEVRKGDDS